MGSLLPVAVRSSQDSFAVVGGSGQQMGEAHDGKGAERNGSGGVAMAQGRVGRLRVRIRHSYVE